MVGAYGKESSPIKSVYTCSLNALLQTCRPQSFGAHPASFLSLSEVWRRETDNIPVVHSSFVSLHGRLLAVGGKDLACKRTLAIHMYDPSSISWVVISHMEHHVVVAMQPLSLLLEGMLTMMACTTADQ